ncbi:unnamed protein product [marine sediment metagenome]|uniref:Uncharacterized protein n=1 Tax=marine sediment metagenome TaxID=412755 RepID=X1S4H8_9ZZZZ
MQQEFRWEYVGIGQGHYHSDIGDCFQLAVDVSRKNPNHTIKIEIFRPKREVIGFLKDGEFITPDRMSAIIEKER